MSQPSATQQVTEQGQQKNRLSKKTYFIVTAGLLYLFFVSPVFMDWNKMIQSVAILLIAQLFWVGRVFPLALTALIVALLMSFHLLSFKEVIGFIGTEIVWLLFSTFIISGAFLKSGLATRLSLYMLRLSSGNSKLLILMAYLLTCLLSLFIPSSLGRAGIVISLMIGIINNLEKDEKCENMSKALMIGFNYVAILTGLLVVTGSATSIYTYGILQSLSEKMTYIMWVQLCVPPILLFIVLYWLMLFKIFPVEKLDQEKILHNINHEINRMGSLSKDEIKMIFVVGFTVILWATESLHGLSISLIGLLGAILTMFPVVGVWSWKEANQQLEWELLIYFSMNLAVAHMLIESGVLKWISDMLISSSILGNEPAGIVIMMVLLTMLIRIFFANSLGFIPVMIPLVLMLGESVDAFSPILLGMAVLLAGTPGFFLVTQGAINVMTFRHGYYRTDELIKAGSVAALIWFFVVVMTSMFFWVNFDL